MKLNDKKILSLAVATFSIVLMSCQGENLQSTNSQPNESSAIVGGSKVDNSDPISKSVIAIVNIEQGYLCTGSIIDASTVLTAAHCASGDISKNLVIFENVIKLDSNIQEGTNVRKVIRGLQHPNYSETSTITKNMSDVAVMHFEGGLPAGYAPAKFLTDYNLLTNSAPVFVAGYGRSNPIESRFLPSGSGTLRKTQLSILNAHYSQTEVQLNQKLRKGVCHGDSGGPAYVKVNNQYLLWGVTSSGAGLPGLPCIFSSVFTRVDQFLPWIQTTAKSLK